MASTSDRALRIRSSDFPVVCRDLSHLAQFFGGGVARGCGL